MGKKSWLLITVLILLAALPVQADKKYWIDAVDVNARILPDGSLEIEETREYRFQGRFRWADYRLPLKDLGAVADFSIQDGDIVYTENETENPGTYTKSIGTKEFYVKWFYAAKDESKRFTLRYRVMDAVTVYADIAEFYFQFVGSNSPKSIGRVDVWLTLPQAADTATVNAWAHGPLHGRLDFVDDKIHLAVAPLKRGKYWEVRAIFPPEWLQPGVSRQMTGMARDNIRAEEKRWADEANARRAEREERQAQRPQVRQFSFLLLAAGGIILSLLYSKFGRKLPTPDEDHAPKELAERLNPALANYINNSGNIDAGALMGTLFDLANRGYVVFKEIAPLKKGLWGSTAKNGKFVIELTEKGETAATELAEHEQEVLRFFFSELSENGKTVALADLSRRSTKVVTWFSKWRKSVHEQWGQPFYDKKSIHGMIYGMLAGGAVIAGGIYVARRYGELGLIGILGGIAVLLFSLSILRFTPNVNYFRDKFSQLKEVLKNKDFGAQPNPEDMSRFLIYGIALGMPETKIKGMLNAIPESQFMTYYPWILFMGGHGGGSRTAFAETVSNMVSVTGTSISTAAGVGGGASVGGGGGAGGAAGGAG